MKIRLRGSSVVEMLLSMQEVLLCSMPGNTKLNKQKEIKIVLFLRYFELCMYYGMVKLSQLTLFITSHNFFSVMRRLETMGGSEGALETDQRSYKEESD